MTKITMIYTFLRDEFRKECEMKMFSVTMDCHRYQGIEYSKEYFIGNRIKSSKSNIRICFEI